jgi:DNA-binding NarL/FixJ family response regulator
MAERPSPVVQSAYCDSRPELLDPHLYYAVKELEMGKGESSVVVLDQHPMWLDGIRGVMERMGLSVVGATTVASEAVDAVAEHEPSLFLVDPDVDDGETRWITCIGQALDVAPDIKVVGVSASGDPDLIEAAFAAGAVAYVVKTASEADIGAALHLALTTAIHVSPGSRTYGNAPAQHDRSDEVGELLTRRELEILQLVAEGHSNAAMGRKLWVTEQTVKFHLSNIYRKLGVRNRTAAARWASLHGVLPASGAEAESDSAQRLPVGSAA